MIIINLNKNMNDYFETSIERVDATFLHENSQVQLVPVRQPLRNGRN